MKKIILAFIAAFLVTGMHSQTGTFFSTDRELSNSLINAIYQDHRNYIWIATEDGLNKYDGVKFTIYRNEKGNPHSLKSNYVRSLYEDSKGRFWIGCVNGLMLYDRVNDTFTEIPLFSANNKLIEPHVSSIIETRNGDILISTSSDAVLKYDAEHACFRVVKQLLPRLCSYYIVSVYEDHLRNLWIASADNGVNCYQPSTGKMQLFKAPESLGNNQISSIIEDGSGNVFVGTLAGGLFRLSVDKKRFEPVPYQNGQTNLPIKNLYIDKFNRLLVGTDGQGIKIYNQQRKCIEDFQVPTATFDFSHTKVHAILLDKVGNLWIGLFQRGVFLSPNHTNKFNYIGNKSFNNNLIGSNCVMSLFKDQQNILWVGTDHDGIYSIDAGNHARHFDIRGNSATVLSTVMAMVEENNSTLWLGSFLDGLIRFDKASGNYKRFVNVNPQKADDPSRNRVMSLLKDKKNRLWVGTNGAGVQLFDIAGSRFVGQFTSESKSGSKLVNNWVNCMINDEEDLVWIGTYGGVNSIDQKTGKVTSFTKSDGTLSSNIVYSIAADHHSNIWFGTSDGLVCYHKKTHKSDFYSTADGLPSNVIRGIIVDNNGDIWLSTHTGISRMMVNQKKFINHFAFDGLQGNEFSLGAAFMARNGEVFFGGVGGVTSFYPSRIVNARDSLQIFLTGLYVLDKPVVKGQRSGGREIIENFICDVETIRLPYTDNMFSLEFSTFNFGNSERVHYRYKLEGLNSQWVNTSPGTNRISFTNLDYGRYTLRVKACVNDNESQEKQIYIRIYPPWYLTLFAKLIYILLLVALIYGILRYISDRMHHRQELMRREHQEQINEAKLQFFINISHEIRTPMTLIISPLEKLIAENKDTARQKVYLMMYRNAQRILRLINQLMDVRKIDKGLMFLKFRETDIVGFIDDLMQTFDYQATKQNISFTFEKSVTSLKAWVDLNNFDKVLLNLISNAFKYTPDGGNITVRLQTGENPQVAGPLSHYFEIVVADTGIGIEADKIEKIFERFYQIDNDVTNANFGTGIGLHLSRSLVELLHGTLEARRRTDCNGSEFIIRLPLGSGHLSSSEMDLNTQNASQEPSKKMALVSLEEKELESAPEKAVKPKTKYKVMIVEDETEIRHYLRSELSSLYKIMESDNGKQALDMILREKPDLVISDVMMPEMDGFTLCKKIKTNININRIPVILLTAKSSDEEKSDGYETGADAYIVKPFNIELLKKRVSNLIDNRERLEVKASDTEENQQLIKQVVLKSSDQVLLEKVIRIINDNIADSELNVEMLAEGVGMSRVHMHRKLKELTNQSARDFIKSIRLKQAAELLRNQKLTVSEVAYALGFTNLSHFSNTFREFYGMSPKEYAQENWKAAESSSKQER